MRQVLHRNRDGYGVESVIVNKRRGVMLLAQIGGQAIGPVVSGFMFDDSGGYLALFEIFGATVSAAVLLLAAAPSQSHGNRLRQD